MTKPNLALFDFDGTLTRKDTLFEIIRYHSGSFGFFTGMLILSPILVLTILKLIPAARGKSILLSYFFAKLPFETFQKNCDSFAIDCIPQLLRPSGISKLKEHQTNGDRVIIVSASAENWIAKWAETTGVELIGTRLAVDNNNLITGKFNGANCKGQEKVNRIKAYLDPNDYEKVFAYGDSSGDREMLAFADEGHYRLFKD